MGKQVRVKCGTKPLIEWRVTGDVKESEVPLVKERFEDIGVTGFDFSKLEVEKGK